LEKHSDDFKNDLNDFEKEVQKQELFRLKGWKTKICLLSK